MLLTRVVNIGQEGLGESMPTAPLMRASALFAELGQKIDSPWSSEFAELVRGLREICAAFDEAQEPAGPLTHNLFIKSAKLFVRLYEEIEVSPLLQFVLPSFCETVGECLQAATTAVFPNTRTILRRSIEAMEEFEASLDCGQAPFAELIGVKTKEALQMAAYLEGAQQESSFRGLLLKRIFELRRVWCGFPDCLEDRNFDVGAVDVKLRRPTEITDDNLSDIEELQKRWIANGRDGIGRIFGREFWAPIFADPLAETVLLEFKLRGKLLGYYILQPDASRVSTLIRDRIASTENSEKIRPANLRAGYFYLALNNDIESTSPVREFELEFGPILYPLMTSIACDIGISRGADIFYALCNINNPAYLAHNNVGYSDSGVRVVAANLDHYLLARPVVLPQIIEQELMLLGRKKSVVRQKSPA